MLPEPNEPADNKRSKKSGLLFATSALLILAMAAAGVFFFQRRQIEEQRENLNRFWTTGRYEDGLTYLSHLKRWGIDRPLRQFYSAAFLTGVNRLEEAKQKLDEAGEITQLSRQVSELRSEIDLRRSTGQFTALYDRNNLPLVSRSFNGDFRIQYDSVRAVLQNQSGDFLSSFKQPNVQGALTLDYRIQSEALKALGKYAGAIVVLDPHNGDILSAASNLKGVGSTYPDRTCLALYHGYEPGSIIKMITFAGAVEKGAHPEKLFPFKCEGSMIFPNQQKFYDWIPHGDLKDVETASAVSCNIGFAKMGFLMKPEDLLGNLKTFGFNDRLQNGFLSLDLGKIKSSELNDLYIADLSIGLDYLEMTPLHMAMVASAIANGGLCMTPKLFAHYRNAVGISYSEQVSIPYRRFIGPRTAELVTKAMESVVLYHEGTGRRAKIDRFPFAIKTGTAGDGSTGYNAMIMGFAPTKNPKIAFAIVAEHSGKAEFEAARITKLFLESIRRYI